MRNIDDLGIKIFADGANIDEMVIMNSTSFIKGMTTNPSLMKKEGIVDYEKFCIDVLDVVKNKPISFEVFTDNFLEMERQADIISSWGDNVYVKIPITNTKKESSTTLIKRLIEKNIKINITAIMTIEQIDGLLPILNENTSIFISIFAGRIADTGRDPITIVKHAISSFKNMSNIEVIWASPRELLNIYQADEVGCHIITLTKDIIKKLEFVGYDLSAYSLDTVKMFYDDSVSAGYQL